MRDGLRLPCGSISLPMPLVVPQPPADRACIAPRLRASPQLIPLVDDESLQDLVENRLVAPGPKRPSSVKRS